MSAVFSGSDRRQFPRLTVKLPVKIKIEDAAGSSHVIEASCRDISAGGICMEMSVHDNADIEKVYEAKSNIQLEIEISEKGKKIHSSGQIMWLRKDQEEDICGVLFNNILPADRDDLSEYIKKGLDL